METRCKILVIQKGTCVNTGVLFVCFWKAKNKEPVAKPALAFPAAPTAVKFLIKIQDPTHTTRLTPGFYQETNPVRGAAEPTLFVVQAYQYRMHLSNKLFKERS